MTTHELISYFKTVFQNNTKNSGVRGNEVVVFTQDEVNSIFNFLAAQGPKLLTVDEVKALKVGTDVWVESYGISKTSVCANTVAWINKRTKEIGFLGGNYLKFRDYNQNSYFSWRVWTSRPTEIQRKETSWNGNN